VKICVQLECEKTKEKVALEKKYSEDYLDSAIVKDFVNVLALGVCELRHGREGCDSVVDCLNELTTTV
jgi:hypothetical protein